MGGFGSTRWRYHSKAPLVEDARALDIGSLRPALELVEASGWIRSTDAEATDPGSELSFTLEPIGRGGYRYLTIEDEAGRRQPIRLLRARVGWHSQWLFQCPTDCGRRARKLYAMPPWTGFACRRCLGLVYRTAQTHDSRLDLARRDPEGFFESRSRAPKTERSGLVTYWLAMRAVNTHRRGRGWGRRSTTPLTRVVAQMRQEYIARWGFAPEDSGRIARGG